MKNRIYSLLERHQKLDSRLRLALSRRAPDPFEISRLKKLKLAIRDRLSSLTRRGIPAS